MTFEVDRYLGKEFSAEFYNCWDFAKEIWLELCGVRLTVATVLQAQAEYEVLKQAISPCLVLMQGRSALPHIGVYYQGRVLHLKPEGARYQPLHLARLGFHTVTFYR